MQRRNPPLKSTFHGSIFQQKYLVWAWLVPFLLTAPTFARMDSPKRRPKERRMIPQARRLFSSPEPTQVAQAGSGWLREGWSEEENKALVEFILFHGANPSEWPTQKHQISEIVINRSYMYLARSAIYSSKVV